MTDEQTSTIIVQRTLDRCVHPVDSENREHSQNSRGKQAVVDKGNVNMTVSVRNNQCSAGDSDFLEHSQNSLLNGEPKVDTGEVNMWFSAHDSQCLAADSKFREVSSNSWVETECSEAHSTSRTQRVYALASPANFCRIC